MTLSVAEILRLPGVELELVSGADGRTNPVRWVHVSEIEDPTPWLKGGELLLTTGMGVGSTPVAQRRYIDRLIEAGLSGLGFGLGFSFQQVPGSLKRAADRRGFPVFTVPYEVPFIAITEAVFTRLVAEQFETLQRSTDAQQELTRAVLEGGGLQGIVHVLARTSGGWAVVMDLHGVPMAAAPRSAESRAARLWEDLRSSRPEGTGFSLSLADRGHHVSVQPVGARGHVEAFLAVGKKEALSHFDRLVAAHALSLVAIELDKARAVSEAERALRGDLLEALAAGTLGDKEVARGLRRFGFRPGGSLVAIAVQAPRNVAEAEWAISDVLSRAGGGFLTSAREDIVLVLAEPTSVPTSKALRDELVARLSDQVLVGSGSRVEATEVARSIREATYALQVCRLEGRGEADFADLGTYRLLLSMQDPGALRAFAESVLAPLEAYDREHGGELIPSLETFLTRNARWEQAAGDLFVHRHTLRYRMRKVEELTSRDLASSHDRMEFWLALRARDLLGTPTRT